jgi:uncharacterized Zn finger protein (UPF0148 family)
MTYANIKIRKEHAQALREVAVRRLVKIADVVGLWPRCPKCMSLLVQVEEGTVVCAACRRGYILVEKSGLL